MANLDCATITRIADWLEAQGYSFRRDPDGFWFEDYVDDHRWSDVMELMDKYSKHVLAHKESPDGR